jgi:hypothetical protein
VAAFDGPARGIALATGVLPASIVAVGALAAIAVTPK